MSLFLSAYSTVTFGGRPETDRVGIRPCRQRKSFTRALAQSAKRLPISVAHDCPLSYQSAN